MSAFCPECKQEVVWAATDNGQTLALNPHSQGRYIFVADSQKVVRWVQTWEAHLCQISKEARQRSIEAITRHVADSLKVSVEDLKSHKRTQHIAFCRQVTWYLIRKLTMTPVELIGECYGRDHSTVVHGVALIKARAENDAAFRRLVDEVEQGLTTKGGDEAAA